MVSIITPTAVEACAVACANGVTADENVFAPVGNPAWLLPPIYETMKVFHNSMAVVVEQKLKGCILVSPENSRMLPVTNYVNNLDS